MVNRYSAKLGVHMNYIDKFIQVPVQDIVSYKRKDVVQIYENYYWIIYRENILINKNGGKMCNIVKKIYLIICLL